MISPGIDMLFLKKGPFCEDVYEPGESGRQYFLSSRILVIGAGGLGCELLKSLALTGFKNIDVIDMDTIDLSNLNRQFLFREKDIGKSKAICAADFIKRRVPNITITPHFCKIQDKTDDFYMQFSVVIGGLDSVNARMWISDKLCDIARETNGDVVIPYVDGGTEEWKGHVKFIIPLESACMRCQSVLFPPPVVYQACTVVSNPRQPEHCIVWAKEFQWPNARGKSLDKNNDQTNVSNHNQSISQNLNVNQHNNNNNIQNTGEQNNADGSCLNNNESVEPIDGDNDEHIKWIMEQAKAHARRNMIDADLITEKLTKGVVKGIIPAIASTQAVIAAMCTTEVLKLMTGTAPNINNNLMYIGNGAQGLFGNHFSFAKDEKCETCARKPTKIINMDSDATVKDLLEKIEREYGFKTSSLRSAEKTLYMPVIKETLANLEKKIAEFVKEGDNLIATSKETKEVFEFVIGGSDK